MPTLTGNITEIFQQHYVKETKHQYQRMGSKLNDLCTGPTGVDASSVRWNILGAKTATTKGRHQKITPNQPNHGTVTAMLEDYHDGAWLDRQDVNKFDVPDNRMAYMQAGAYALGRKADDIVIQNGLVASIGQGAGEVDNNGAATKGMLLTKANYASRLLSERNVGYGMRTFLVAPAQWADMMNIPQFASADYISEKIWDKEMIERPRIFDGALWMSFTGLPYDADNKVRTTFLWDKAAIGSADNGDMEADITWHGDYAAWFLAHYGNGAAAPILPEGVIAVYCKEEVPTF